MTGEFANCVRLLLTTGDFPHVRLQLHLHLTDIPTVGVGTQQSGFEDASLLSAVAYLAWIGTS